ncbi:MAG: hypothetical protein RL662_313 [Bacteroidota bacterium]|jgi:uncharacterized protein YijF (DUF1287 family)
MNIKSSFIVLVFFLCVFSAVKGQDVQFYTKLSDATISLTQDRVWYDPAYYKIAYPNGDVPANRGVCTDVVIRAYRKLGIDLQKEVHEDMKANFNLYPSRKKWGMKGTDTNIDHRRVPNLQAFFTRKGVVKSISNKPEDYLVGDIVTWDLGKGLVHIGIVVDKKTRDGKRPLLVHNIGWGQVAEDILFDWKITGHYRYKK